MAPYQHTRSRQRGDLPHIHVTRKDAINHLARGRYPVNAGQMRSMMSRGLRNPNNICYRRAAIQSLLHLPRLLHYLHQASAPWAQLQALAQEYWSVKSELEVKNPPVLTTNASSILLAFDQWVRTSTWPSPSIAVQHDTAEFLFWMIEAMRTHAFSNFAAREIVQLDGLFTVTLRRTQTCPICDMHTTIPNEDYNNGIFFLNNQNTLSVSLIPGSVNPNDGINYPKANTLDYYISRSFNDWRLVNCSNVACPGATQVGGVMMNRISKIISAPQYFILRLTTLYFDPATGLHRKQDTPADFKVPSTLDIAKHCSWNPSTYRYKLSSIVVHRGDSFQAGHYYGFFTAPGGSRYVSDARAVNENSVSSFQDRHMTQDKDLPYIVVYKRI